MLDRFKEFIGIDDNYDDYDDDQMYYDDDNDHVEEEKSRKTYSDTFEEKERDTYKSSSLSSVKGSFSDDYAYNDTYKTTKTADNLADMNDSSFSRSSNMKISIQEPIDYENDAPVVIEEILKNSVVVLNLEMVDNDLRMRIFDFVSGAVYALKGNMEKVTKGIFVITPNGVQIDSYVTDQISEGKYNQL